jgi:hypothetical protein
VADPLIALARRLARKAGRPVPTPNPNGPTTKALALFVLRDPGATPESGAAKTGVLDPFLNDDRTATRTQRLLAAVRIDPDICVWWNASPYHLGYDRTIRPVDHAFGVAALEQFLALCPDLRVVVAMGEDAWPVVDEVWTKSAARLPPLIKTWHPMTRGRGAAQRLPLQAAALRKAARLIGRGSALG